MNVTVKNINSVLNTNQLVVLFFTSPTCGPCSGVRIMLGMVRQKYGKAVYAEVNVHADEEVPKRYQVRTSPTLVFIKQNKVVGRLSGTITQQQILSIVQSHLDK